MNAAIDDKVLRAEVSSILNLRWFRFAVSFVPAHLMSGLVWWLGRDSEPVGIFAMSFFTWWGCYIFSYRYFSGWARPLGIEGRYLRWRFKKRYPPECAERRLVLNLLRERDIELFMAVLLEGERVGGNASAAAPVRGVNLSLPFPPEVPPPAVPPPLETTPKVIPLQPETRKGNE